MKKTYFNSFCARYLTLLVLALLSTNLAWGEEVTMSYSSSETKNMTGGNDANLVNLNAVTWSVVGDKGGNNNFPGLNKDGQIRLYGSDTNHNTITVTNLAEANITSIKVTYGASHYNAKVTVDGAEVTGTGSDTEKTYAINSTSFTIAHNYSANTQVYILSIVITTSSTTPTKELVSLAVSGAPDKKNYKSNEAFDPTGLTVTGYYDDETNAPITSGIDWIVDPSGNLPVGTTSVSVTAKVGEITSEAHTVNGLTVTEFVQTYANTYTSNVELSTYGGTSASTAKVVIGGTEYDAIKAGASSTKGKCVVTIPANTKTLHFHAAGWNGETVKLDVNDTEYTLVADKNVQGSGTKFTLQNDPEKQDYFTLDPKGATTITFTASATTTGKRFVLFGVNAEPFKAQDVTITAAGWATACLPFNATISDNATAYYVTTSGSTLNKVGANVIPANEGVLLKSNEGGAATVTFTPSTDATDEVTANYMKGSVAGETFDESGYKYYILANDETNGLGFYYQGADNTTGSSVTCAAGKAVLAVPETTDAKAFFSLDNEPTGITSYENDNDNENLKAMIVYNLNGMKVNNSYKGIVIMNGKKYINK